MKLLDMKQDYIEHTHAAEGIYLKAAAEKRDYTPQDNATMTRTSRRQRNLTPKSRPRAAVPDHFARRLAGTFPA